MRPSIARTQIHGELMEFLCPRGMRRARLFPPMARRSDSTMSAMRCGPSNNAPRWGLFDILAWKVIPTQIGGGRPYIQKFKDAWIRYHKQRIKSSALAHRLPPELLAGVCWIEVGGDPHFIDHAALEFRSFDWSGPSFVDAHLTISNHPTKTSFGSVSMQLRTASQTLGIDVRELSTEQLRSLSRCLENDVFNIEIAARHLRQLINHDKLAAPISMEAIRIVGARYNRGIGLSLAQIKKDTSYGNFIVEHWPRFAQLLR